MSKLNGTLSSEAVDSAFANDVLKGLQAQPKSLPSKYFYDEKGDKIFQEIMAMEEYYLTRAEHSIFRQQKEEIFDAINVDGEPFRLLELGAGDGLKTRVLLEYFQSTGVAFDYSPVDISSHVLEICKEKVQKELPDLSITPLAGDYFDVLSSINYDTSKRNVVLFLGSNIGNFTNESAIPFLRRLREYLHVGDYLLIGFDLKKDPDMILKAYHDEAGITKRFNLNLLDRINRELDGDIDIEAFEHYPIYNPATGECRSYLINTYYQRFTIGALEKEFELEAWEPIFTEVSKKYSRAEIGQLAEASGFEKVSDFYDNNQYFVDSLWRVPN